MSEHEREQRKVAMVIVAHPDDAEFGAAGTVATWVREGWDVYYVICTDAAGGGPDDATDVGPTAKHKISETRKSEQRAAGAVLGLKDVFFLDHPVLFASLPIEHGHQLFTLVVTIQITWLPARRH